ncbi:MAG TPA: hypothetical protein VFL91_01935 [Thermomicrobiales bacterium]|nr:hypothetical protein [Thermomicrobiales bacterium]
MGSPWPPGLGLALLVREGDSHGLGPVTLLRRALVGGTRCWRERLELATPAVELW